MDDIVWTEEALRDLDDIGSFIALDDPTAAAGVVRRIGEAVGGLSYFPRIGREGRTEGTRELVIGGTPYVAVYRLREQIQILAIVHGARRWPAEL